MQQITLEDPNQDIVDSNDIFTIKQFLSTHNYKSISSTGTNWYKSSRSTFNNARENIYKPFDTIEKIKSTPSSAHEIQKKRPQSNVNKILSDQMEKNYQKDQNSLLKKQNRKFKNQFNNFHINTIKSNIQKDIVQQNKFNQRIENEFQNVIYINQKPISLSKKRGMTMQDNFYITQQDLDQEQRFDTTQNNFFQMTATNQKIQKAIDTKMYLDLTQKYAQEFQFNPLNTKNVMTMGRKLSDAKYIRLRKQKNDIQLVKPLGFYQHKS